MLKVFCIHAEKDTVKVCNVNIAENFSKERYATPCDFCNQAIKVVA